MSEHERFAHAEKLRAMTINNLADMRAELDRLLPQTPMTEARYVALKRIAKLIGDCTLEVL